MKIKNGKSLIAKYKRQIFLNSKIKDTLSFFNKTNYNPKNNSKKSFNAHKTQPSLYNTSFLKTTTFLNKTHRNLSFNNINNIYMLEPINQTTNPLNSIYKNTFFPNSLKNKNYIREIYNGLPYLKLNNEITDDKKIDKNEKDNGKVKEILLTEYNNSVKKFKDIYKNSGEELDNELKGKEISNESILEFMKSNRVNIEEKNYISSIIKSKRKNYSVEFETENYISPKNSLMTLKINNQLINNIRECVKKYEYNSYAEKINENQQNKLKLLIMPKLNIKFTKYNFENSDGGAKTNKENKENLRKLSYFKKFNAFKFGNSKNKKDNKNENEKNNKNKKIDTSDEFKEEDINIEEKITIDSINMRNSLIIDVKSYYCKYLRRNIFCPSSRIGATFTKYKNKLYLFGGSTSNETNELWTLEVKAKKPFWKKIEYITEQNMTLNTRYGHSCVYFNNNLYIFGGNINLKNLKNALEDILIYNLKLNTLKVANFKREPFSLTSSNIYVPQRRNHIAHVIGFNMIVHGGIDITKEYLKENVIYNPNSAEIKINQENIFFKNNESFILNDWMLLDLITLKWSQINNIKYKLKDKKMMKNVKSRGGIYRVYHSSCLILSYDSIMKGNKINIYRNNNNIKYDTVEKEGENDVNAYDFEKEGKYKFDINYEGIYIFGGLDENLKETNNLFILHCFRNPLIFFEPQIKGIPPEKRSMASINFDKDLNIITLYGGKDVFRVFNDLYVLDVVNFEWIKINLFGPENICKRMGHCSGIINQKLYIFGGCDEDNKYPYAKTLSIELDILNNRLLSKIYNFAQSSLKQSQKKEEGKIILKILREGNEIPKNLYPFLHFNG